LTQIKQHVAIITLSAKIWLRTPVRRVLWRFSWAYHKLLTHFDLWLIATPSPLVWVVIYRQEAYQAVSTGTVMATYKDNL